MAGPKDLKGGHEHGEINTRAIYKFGIGLIILAAILQLPLYGIFRYFNAEEKKADPRISPLAEGASQIPPAPRLQVTPILDLRQFRKQEDQILNTYGWVDKSKGIVRIPVKEAMKLVLEKNRLTPQTQTEPSK